MKRLICAIAVISVLSACSRPIIPMFVSPIRKAYLPIVIMPKAKYFAWSLEWDNRIPMQLFTLDARQERQYSCSASEAAQFAAIHRGQLYIACDEPDINVWTWQTPTDYAIWYHSFVMTVRAADPTARFSPAGFALTSPGLHFTDYAHAFYNEYIRLYGVVPPVSEWRFHAFICNPADINWWRSNVHDASIWSATHGAKMTLGSFGMPCHTPDPNITATMLAMHNAIESDPNIISAAWWSFDWFGWEHTLELPNGSLSSEGILYRQWK